MHLPKHLTFQYAIYFEVTNKIDEMHYLHLLEKYWYQYHINFDFKHRTGKNPINTLHNTKRLGPFLGFGCNFGEKQNKCLKMDLKSVCLM